MGELANSLDELTNEDLAQLCAERPVREEAWDAFYRRFHGLVRGQIKRTLKGFPMEIEDLVQTCFVQIFKALPRYDRNRGRVTTYLARVVTNAVIDVLRNGHEARQSTVSLDTELALLQIRAERDPLLLQAMAKHIVDRLSDKRKIAILNDLLDGCDVNEICIERKATQYEVYTARRWLHDLLREVGGSIQR